MFGINNSYIREKLIDNELILSSAIEIAQTYEVSRQQLKTKYMTVEKYMIREGWPEFKALCPRCL